MAKGAKRHCTMQACITLATIFLLSQIPQQCVTTRHFIGVPLEKRSLYEPTSDEQFRCLDGAGTIPFDYVNDNYCDCRDSSDEPGTAACPDGVFYCANHGYVERYLPAGLVNDGICDCCDTSDEYNTTAQCVNTCEQLGESMRLEQERFREIAEQGATRRTQYKEEAKQKHEEDKQQLATLKQELSDKEQAIRDLESKLSSDFGPDRVFMPLKGKCFKYEDREYTYTFCPFDRATQESNTGMQTELGRWGAWAGPENNIYSVQKYEGGYQCWNGPARNVVVNIQCGAEDKLMAVSEPTRCEYMYDFSTPAACPDLNPDPPSPEPDASQVSGEANTFNDDAGTQLQDDGTEYQHEDGQDEEELHYIKDDHELEREDGSDINQDFSNEPTESIPSEQQHDEL